MAVTTCTVHWTIPDLGTGEAHTLSWVPAVPGGNPAAVLLDGGVSLGGWEDAESVSPGDPMQIALPHVDQPATVGGVPVTGWSYVLTVTSGARTATVIVAPRGGVAVLDLGLGAALQALGSAAAAGEAAASAAAASHISQVPPTSGDAVGRPEGAEWVVIEPGTGVTRARYVLQSGAWRRSSTAAGALVTSAASNLVPDPGMQRPELWVEGGVCEVQPTSGPSGAPALWVIPAPAINLDPRILWTPSFQVAPGEALRISVEVRSATAPIAQTRMFLRFTGPSGDTDSAPVSVWSSTSEWQTHSADIIVPAGAMSAKLVVESFSPTTASRTGFWLATFRAVRLLDAALLIGVIDRDRLPEPLHATTGRFGVVELSTNDETMAGSSGDVVVTPASLSARIATTTASGLVWFATTAEVVAGISSVLAVTPAGVKAAIDARDSGWQTLTLLSGWTAVSGWAAPQYRVINGVVQLRGRINGTAAATNILRLPVAGRPAAFGDVVTYIADAGGAVRVAAYTRAAGNITGDIDGFLFVAGKSGAISNLSLTGTFWSTT